MPLEPAHSGESEPDRGVNLTLAAGAPAASDSFYPWRVAGSYHRAMRTLFIPSARRTLLSIAAIAAIETLAAPRAGTAETAVPLLPIERLFAKADVASVQVDPAGRALAVIERVGGHPAIVLRTLAGTRVRTVFQDTTRSVSNVRWSRDGRWMLALHDRGGEEGYHLLRLDPRQTNTMAVDLTPMAGAEVDLLALPDGDPDAAIIASNHRDPRLSDVYRLRLSSGRLEELARNPGDVTVWGVSRRGEVLAASAVLQDGTLDLRTRTRAGKPWRSVYRAGPAERFTLLGLAGRSPLVLARSNRDRATEEFVWIDPATGAVVRRQASACAGFDAGELRRLPNGAVLGEACTAAGLRFVASSPAMRQAITKAVAGGELRAVELESISDDGRTFVVFTHAATDPGRFILVDGRRHTSKTLFEARPGVDRTALAPTEFLWFAARDGLRLSALLTRSPIGPAGPQPAVLVVHGGPWTRDEIGFSPETQMLANRGYAVLQVNFRGSTGLGRATVDGGVGEFGGRMSDDLLDGLDWAAARGAIDPARVCVLGGSYGGFAALVAMTRDAARFRCGVDYAGPVDLETLIRAFPPSWGPFLPRSWYRFVGNPGDPEALRRMRDASPLQHLDKARAPLLVFQGANDPRVRTEHAVRVVRAWRDRLLPVTLLYAANEGHSFNEEETALAVNRSVELFFGRWLGGRVQPSAAPSVEAAIERLTKAGEALHTPAPAPLTPASGEAAVAAYLPARRAARTEPNLALKGEG